MYPRGGAGLTESIGQRAACGCRALAQTSDATSKRVTFYQPGSMTGSPHLVTASGNYLCSNPRMVKEADALSAAGFEVNESQKMYLDEQTSPQHGLDTTSSERFRAGGFH